MNVFQFPNKNTAKKPPATLEGVLAKALRLHQNLMDLYLMRGVYSESELDHMLELHAATAELLQMVDKK